MSAPGLPDYIRTGLAALLVGINPGLRSARLGHHFAGRGNRFWDLLSDAGLTARRLTFEEDRTLTDLGLGITNLVSRPTRGSTDLAPADFRRGRRELARKVRRFAPRTLVFVGITAYREFFHRPGPVAPGRQSIDFEGTPVFVLPNPSGRNAHFSYRQMLRHYRGLARFLKRARAA